jgi:GT2 family glycosyltransferase
MESIATITTAYNAMRILPRQIDALLAQTRPLQEIIVVDNASTDGTSEMLAQRYPQVTVLRLEKNVGASGGWAAGLKYAALEKKHDWIWNFDDDTVPAEDALQIMLTSWAEAARESMVGMLAPLPIHQETGVYYPPLLWRDGLVKPPKELLDQLVWFADVAVASGCLVRRDVVETVGLPREDFFMDCFDFEYCLRIRKHGYRIAVVNRCRFLHELGDTIVRRFGGYSHIWAKHSPWREYYMTRNFIYTGFWLYPTPKTKRFIVLNLLRHAGAIMLFGAERSATFKKIFQGIIDGKRGRLGIRFLPN